MNGRRKSIVLIGMMGAGKSFVGRCLQRRTGLDLCDLDEVVTSKFGISIPEIFSKHGEDKFRKAETAALRSVATMEQTIIVTGGGIVLRKENVDLLNRTGVIVWLDGKEGMLFKRASQSRNRPLLQGKNPRKRFVQILQARRSHYAKLAHLRIDTSILTGEEVAVAILSKLRALSRNRAPGSAIPATA